MSGVARRDTGARMIRSVPSADGESDKTALPKAARPKWLSRSRWSVAVHFSDKGEPLNARPCRSLSLVERWTELDA